MKDKASIVDAVVQKIYENEEQQIWEEGLQNSPHGIPWHVSFHASEFPGENPKPCARKAMYSLMDIPQKEPIPPQLRAQGELGKAAEEAIVWRFHRAGILATRPPDAEHQMGFMDREAWLTGSPDAIIHLPRGYHVVEIKNRSDDIVNAMKTGQRFCDEKHYNQLQAYLGLIQHNEYEEVHVHQAKEGSVYYISRENPLNAVEYRFPADENFYLSGKEILKEWKQYFLDGVLPERPEDWKWSEEPCKYCPFKKFACKPDFKEDVKKLEESGSISFAQEVRPEYDYPEKRRNVLNHWSK